MANKIWTGNALALSHIVTLTVGGTIAIGDTFSVSINGKSITFAATTTNIADVVLGLLSTWSNLDGTTYPEFGEITTAPNSLVTPTGIVCTYNAAGVPFTLAVTKVSAAGTFTQATTQTASGPYHWDNPANWADGSLPVTGDSVVIDLPKASIRYGLGQSAVTLASLFIQGEIDIGLPRYAQAGYANYLPTYLAIGATKIYVRSTGQRVKLNTGAVATTLQIDGTGSGDSGSPGFLWIGTNAANALYRNGGTVGVAYDPFQTATLATLGISGDGSSDSDACVIGAGATITNFRQTGSLVKLYAAPSSVRVLGGTLQILGNASLTFPELSAYGGEVQWEAPGTITALNASVPIKRIGQQPGTITAGNILNKDAFPQDPNRTLNWGAMACPPDGVNILNPGYGMTITLSRTFA